MSVCFASPTPGLCSAFSLASFSLAHVLFVIWVCFASQTLVLCSASRFDSPLPCTRFYFVKWVCFASQTPGLCRAFLFSFPLPCTCFICYVVCFASQSSILCSVYLFGFPPLFCTPLFVCRCASPRNPWCCTVLFFLRPFGILFAYPFFVVYGNFLFRVFRITSFGFARCIRFLPCYLYDLLFFFPFRYLAFSNILPLNGFLFSPFLAVFPLPRVLVSCLIRFSFASQTMVLCSAFRSPLF